MLAYINRKKQCISCMKTLSDQDVVAVRKKIEKIIRKTKERIKEIEENYNLQGGNNGMDPTPMIREI